MRKTIVKVHRWCALILGMWLLLQALGGLALVFKPQLMWALYPDVEEYEGVVSLERMIDIAGRTYPDYRLSRLTYPAPGHETFIATLQRKQGEDSLKAVFQPGNEQYIRLKGSEKLPDWLFNFHDHILFPGAGRTLVGLLGGCLIFWSLSGIYLWWPGLNKRPLAINLQGPRRLKLYDLHRVFGVVLSLFLIVLAVSGMMMVYRGSIMEVFHMDRNVDHDIPLGLTACEQQGGLDSFIACLGRHVSHAGIKDVRFNGSGTEATILYYAADVIRPLAVDKLRVTLAKPKLISVENAKSESRGVAFMNWMYPVHTGKILGKIGVGVMTVIGIGLVLIISFGTWLWCEKRNSKKGKKHA